MSVDYQGGRVVAIQFADSSLITRHMEAVQDLVALKKMVFARTSVSGNTLAKLGALEGLEELEIDGATNFYDGALFQSLAALPHLKRVTLRGVLVGEDVLQRLREQRPGIEFELHPPRDMTDYWAPTPGLTEEILPFEPPPSVQVRRPIDLH